MSRAAFLWLLVFLVAASPIGTTPFTGSALPQYAHLVTDGVAGDVVGVTIGFATVDHTIGAPLYAVVTWNFAAQPGSGTYLASDCQTGSTGSSLQAFSFGNGGSPGSFNVTNPRCLVAQPPGMEDYWLTGGFGQYANTSAPVLNVSIAVSGSSQTVVFGDALLPSGVATASDVAPVRSLYAGLTTVTLGAVGCYNSSNPNQGAKGCSTALNANDTHEFARSYANVSWSSLPAGATAAHAIAFHALCSQVATIEQDSIALAPPNPLGPVGTTVLAIAPGVTFWNATAFTADREYCVALEATLANGTVQWSNLVPVTPVGTLPFGQYPGNPQFAGPGNVNTGSTAAGTYVFNFGCQNLPCRVAWGNLSLVGVSNVSYGLAWATLGISYLGSLPSAQYVGAGSHYPQLVEVWAGTNCLSGYQGSYPWNTTAATITVPLSDWWGGQTVAGGEGWSAAIVSGWSASPYGFSSVCVPIYIPQSPLPSTGRGGFILQFPGTAQQLAADSLSPAGVGFWFLVGVAAVAAGWRRHERIRARASPG